jgi:hypothetical protein
MTRSVLRSLFKNLLAFRSLYAAEGVDTVYGPGGSAYSLFDVETLYAARVLLSDRQCQAIELFLVQNLREKDVALLMGVSENNPVASYATHGMDALLKMAAEGNLNRYRLDRDEDESAALRDACSVGGSGQRADSPVAGGRYLHEREVGHPDAVEGDGPQAPGGLYGGRSPRRIVATWHVPPGVEFSAPAPELCRRESASTRRPPRWSIRAKVRARP